MLWQNQKYTACKKTSKYHWLCADLPARERRCHQCAQKDRYRERERERERESCRDLFKSIRSCSEDVCCIYVFWWTHKTQQLTTNITIGTPSRDGLSVGFGDFTLRLPLGLAPISKLVPPPRKLRSKNPKVARNIWQKLRKKSEKLRQSCAQIWIFSDVKY